MFKINKFEENADFFIYKVIGFLEEIVSNLFVQI